MTTPRRALQSTLLLAAGAAAAVAIAPPADAPVAFVPVADETPTATEPVTVTETTTVTTTQTVTAPPQTVTETVTVPGPTVTQTVTSAPPVVVPPPTTPRMRTGAELLADARRAADAKVVRLDPPALTPGLVYVQPSIRTGRGRLTVDDEDVVPLLVLACPEVDCDAGVSATVARRSRSGRPTKTFRLRRATFSLEAGRMRLVAVRLTAPQRRAIRAARSATMRISMAASGPGGIRSTRSLVVTLRIRAARTAGD